jgi:hypothetical protein
MSENPDKIQDYIRDTRFNDGNIIQLTGSYIIIDFFNDLLDDFVTSQKKNEVEH